MCIKSHLSFLVERTFAGLLLYKVCVSVAKQLTFLVALLPLTGIMIESLRPLYLPIGATCWLSIHFLAISTEMNSTKAKPRLRPICHGARNTHGGVNSGRLIQYREQIRTRHLPASWIAQNSTPLLWEAFSLSVRRWFGLLSGDF